MWAGHVLFQGAGNRCGNDLPHSSADWGSPSKGEGTPAEHPMVWRSQELSPLLEEEVKKEEEEVKNEEVEDELEEGVEEDRCQGRKAGGRLKGW